jgi:hypothetical protein
MKIDFKYYDKTILLFAFRYALGRMSTAPSIVTDLIRDNWDRIDSVTRNQIKSEINDAIRLDTIGMEMDKKTWESVLNL